MARRDIEPSTFRVTPRTGRRMVRSEGRLPNLVSKKARQRVPDFTKLQAGGVRGWPEPASKSALCKPPARGPKPCFVRVLFVGAKLAAKYQKREGAYLVGCNDSAAPAYHPSQWIPVRDHVDAKRKSDAFCECRARGDDPDQCAIRVSKLRTRSLP